MSLVIGWLAFPLVLLALSLGCGLLVERAHGARIPGTLLAPVGFALVVVVTQIASYWDATAELATPVVLAVAAAGFVTSRARLRRRDVDRWAASAAAGVFAVFAAPVVLSGEATFAGYTLLGDTSIHFVLIDRVMEHARDVSGLEPSSYRSALDAYFGSAYPDGSHTPLGAVRPLVGQDVAWVFQPYLACLAALTSLALYSLATPVRQRPLRAVIAFVAAQPALVFAFSLQGSVKEMATVLLLTTLVALVPVFLEESARVRAVVPLAVAASGALGVLSLAIAPWLGLILAATLAALIWRRRTAPLLRPLGPERTVKASIIDRLTLTQCGAFAVLVAAMAFPSLVESADFVSVAEGVATAPTEVGNLIGPLDRLQVVGIWPVGDYRLAPTGLSLAVAYVLIGVALAAAALGIAWMFRRRHGGPLLYLAVSLVAGSFVLLRGSPWVDAKALMIASPAVMLTALLGAGALLARGRRFEAVLLVTALGIGVLWSNALAYRAVRLAPRDRLAELQDLGDTVAGRGPTLYTEFEEFAKHFLREGDPTGSSEAWQPPSPTGERGRFNRSEDVDRFSLAYLLHYRLIVLRRSPSISRPPSPYRRVFAGSFYEVWRRASSASKPVAEHLALGNGVQPAARPRCNDVRGLAARARRGGGKLAYVVRPLSLTAAPGALRSRSPGRYRVWLEGSFGRGYDVRIDGRRIGTASYELNGPGQYAYVGEVALTRGVHDASVSLAGVSLHPGNGSGDRRLRRMVIAPMASEDRRVRYLDPGRFHELCRRDLDWLEVVGT